MYSNFIYVIHKTPTSAEVGFVHLLLLRAELLSVAKSFLKQTFLSYGPNSKY